MNKSEIKIRELLTKAKEKDSRAINEFIQIHQDLNRYIIERIIRTTGTYFSIDELTAIGLMGIFKSIESYDETRGTIKNHVAYQIRSEVNNFLTGNSHIVRADKRTVFNQEITEIVDNNYQIDETYENNDNRAHLRDFLVNKMSKLNERENNVLNGLYFDELNYSELSVQMNIPVSTVYSLEKAALKKLKNLFDS